MEKTHRRKLEHLPSENILKSRKFQFIILSLFCLQLYFLFGVESYSSTDVYGQTVTFGTPNGFGVALLILPAVLIAYVVWKQVRRERE